MRRTPKTEAGRAVSVISNPDAVTKEILRLLNSLSEEDKAKVAAELVQVSYDKYDNGEEHDDYEAGAYIKASLADIPLPLVDTGYL